MSVVTNVMVSFGHGEPPEVLGRLRGWFDAKGGLGAVTHGFSDPAPYSWGGNKHPECNLLAGAYNHLDLQSMLEHIQALEWESPELVQLFVKEEEEATFCVYMFRDGRLTRVLPYAAWPSA